jgi:ATPase subunit of ABC transporter with duplicated ATPase domains
MKVMLKIAIVVVGTVLMLVMDLAFLQVVDEAEAVAGVRRRTARRTAVVVGSTTAAAAGAATASADQQAAAAQQQAAAAQQQAATANAEAEAAKQQAAASQAEAEAYKQQVAAAQAAAAPAGGPLPLGTVVTALPAGCTTMSSGGVEYQSCGGNYYRAAFQGSQLVYVTAQP